MYLSTQQYFWNFKSTPWAIKKPTYLYLYLRQKTVHFNAGFTVRFENERYVWCTCHPPHVTNVATLPCEIRKKRKRNITAVVNYGADRGGSRKKYLGGPGPSSFGRQQRLSKIIIEPIISTESHSGARESILAGPYCNLIPTETSHQLSTRKTSHALPLR